MKRGRPHGHVRLLDDLGRFEVAAWFAFTELGMTPYSAAYLVTFLLASDKPITTESVEGVLLKSTTIHATTIIGHADRIRRKAPQMIKRADEAERAWLAQSSAAPHARPHRMRDRYGVERLTAVERPGRRRQNRVNTA